MRTMNGMSFSARNVIQAVPTNSRSAINPAMAPAPKTAQKRDSRASRWAVVELPARSSTSHRTGMAMPLWPMASIRMLRSRRPNFQHVRSRARSHGPDPIPAIRTTARQLIAVEHDLLEEALQAAIVRRDFGPGRERAGQVAQVDGPRQENAHDEDAETLQSALAQQKVLPQALPQGGDALASHASSRSKPQTNRESYRPIKTLGKIVVYCA